MQFHGHRAPGGSGNACRQYPHHHLHHHHLQKKERCTVSEQAGAVPGDVSRLSVFQRATALAISLLC